MNSRTSRNCFSPSFPQLTSRRGAPGRARPTSSAIATDRGPSSWTNTTISGGADFPGAEYPSLWSVVPTRSRNPATLAPRRATKGRVCFKQDFRIVFEVLCCRRRTARQSPGRVQYLPDRRQRGVFRAALPRPGYLSNNFIFSDIEPEVGSLQPTRKGVNFLCAKLLPDALYLYRSPREVLGAARTIVPLQT